MVINLTLSDLTNFVRFSFAIASVFQYQDHHGSELLAEVGKLWGSISILVLNAHGFLLLGLSSWGKRLE